MAGARMLPERATRRASTRRPHLVILLAPPSASHFRAPHGARLGVESRCASEDDGRRGALAESGDAAVRQPTRRATASFGGIIW